jgi:predicted Zn-dependent protease
MNWGRLLRKVSWLWLPALLLAATACQSVQTTQPGALGVSRQQSMAVSRQQIDQASQEAYNKMLAEAQQKGILNRDFAATQRVQRIAARLIPHTAAFRSDAPGWRWEVNVFSSDQVNAFCMAGGKIGVYTGLIQKLNITDDELAAVVGHEIGHALREHVREAVSRQMVTGTLLSIGATGLAIATGTGSSGAQLGQQLGGMVTQVMFTLPNSRENEQEADLIGLELAARGGFDPRAATTLWQKMASLGGGSGPSFLSTHPSPASRQADLTSAAQRVLPLYEAALQRR